MVAARAYNSDYVVAPNSDLDVYLRPYQGKDYRNILRHLFNGDKELVLNSPTGAGKTVLVQAILSAVVGTRFSHGLVVAPQTQIKDGFLPEKGVEAYRYIFPEEKGHVSSNVVQFNPSKWLNQPKSYSFADFIKAAQPTQNIYCCTHQFIHRRLSDLPKPTRANKLPLTGYLLVPDEAHHAGERTHLGAFIKKWLALGGTVLFVTATAFRTADDLLIGENATYFIRTLADQSAEGYAPRHTEIRTRRISLTADDHRQVAGEYQGKGNFNKSCDEIVDLWNFDGRPKSVVIVPQYNSLEWAGILENKFLECGVNVENVVGNFTKDREDDFKRMLDVERDATEYEGTFGSNVDVIIACKRFDEGTDWKFCSHVYNIGLCASFGLILQRLGRATRVKTYKREGKRECGIKGYPKEFAEVASFTFLLLNCSDDVWKKFESHHKDHVYLIACFMSDMKTGKRYHAFRLRMEDFGRKRSGSKEAAETLQNHIEDFCQAYEFTTEQATRYTRHKVMAETILTEQNQPITPRNVANVLKMKGETEETIQAVQRLMVRNAKDNSPAIDVLVRRAEKFLNTKGFNVGSRIIAKDMREVWDEVISDLQDVEFEHDTDVLSHASQFTGRDAKELAKQLANAGNGSAAANKLKLLEMAKAGMERPNQGKGNKDFVIRQLGRVLIDYTNKKEKSYDLDFDCEIRRLAPHWFENTADVKKQQLLEMAEKGLSRPSSTSKDPEIKKLGAALPSYTNESSGTYDREFNREIRRLVPQWFEDTASLKKNLLFEMAEKGMGRPSARSVIGRALGSYTGKNKSTYDSDFDAEIRRIARCWFENTADVKKQQLLEMAKKGLSRPSGKNTNPEIRSLGTALTAYINKYHGSYDPDFDSEIHCAAPHWFNDTADIKKKQLLEMAEKDVDRPNSKSKDSEIRKLGSALVEYTNSGKSSYDPDFDARIRRLAPRWFEDIADVKKKQLLVVAKKGMNRPSSTSKDPEIKSLGTGLISYTSKNNKSYDPDFDREIRCIAPRWFEDVAGLNKKQLLEMADNNGSTRPSKHSKDPEISRLGKALNSYITKSHTSFDSEFNHKIRRLAPHWFK